MCATESIISSKKSACVCQSASPSSEGPELPADGLLLGDEAIANLHDAGDGVGGPVDLHGANGLADVVAVEGDASVGRTAVEFDVGPFGDLGKGGFIVQRRRGVQCRQGHGPVHGAGVEVGDLQPGGEFPGGGAFSRTSGAVDCNNHERVRSPGL